MNGFKDTNFILKLVRRFWLLIELGSILEDKESKLRGSLKNNNAYVKKEELKKSVLKVKEKKP